MSIEVFKTFLDYILQYLLVLCYPLAVPAYGACVTAGLTAVEDPRKCFFFNINRTLKNLQMIKQKFCNMSDTLQ